MDICDCGLKLFCRRARQVAKLVFPPESTENTVQVRHAVYVISAFFQPPQKFGMLELCKKAARIFYVQGERCKIGFFRKIEIYSVAAASGFCLKGLYRIAGIFGQIDDVVLFYMDFSRRKSKTALAAGVQDKSMGGAVIVYRRSAAGRNEAHVGDFQNTEFLLHEGFHWITPFRFIIHCCVGIVK